jgi:hypothetical protein
VPKAHWKIQNQRTKVLNLARALARSGQHETHHSILAELEIVEGFVEAYGRLTDQVISSQLDRLCAMAQAPARGSKVAAFLAKTRQAARH